MKVVSKQLNSHDCLVCGIDNEFGLHCHFYNTEDNKVVTKFSFKDYHQSYPERVHGGMSAALLDELIGRAIWVTDPGQYGVTIKLETKYRKPVPYNTPLIGVGWIESRTTRTFTASGHITDLDGNVLVEATGTYMMLPPEKITSVTDEHAQMFLVPDNVKEI